MNLLKWSILPLLLCSCISTSNKSIGRHKSSKKALTIMTYNVANLFDTKRDQGKNDHTYLPLKKKTAAVRQACNRIPQSWWRKDCLNKDWTEKNLDLLQSRLADVILSSKEKGPEIIILQEVENKAVVEQLRKKYLAGKGYLPTIHLESSDKRGIDVAILSKIPIIGTPKKYAVHLKAHGNLKKFATKWVNGKKVVREILHAVLKLPDNSRLNVLGLHFPSQALPTEARQQAIDILNKVTTRLRQKKELVVIAGDFNISKEEERESQLYYQQLGKNWLIANSLGCEKCKGTYFYYPNKSWSFLDNILFSKNMKESAKWIIVPKSIRIFNKSIYQTNRFGSPAKFKPTTPVGVSDHWPLLADIVLNPKN